MGETSESTLWIKNIVIFNDDDHEYDYLLDNYLGNSYSKYSSYAECTYHPSKSPLCPIFKLKDIIDSTPNAGESYEEMAKLGGVILITIRWNCWHKSWKWIESLFPDNKCTPVYSFKRIDNEKGKDPLERSAYGDNSYFNNMKSRVRIRSYKIRFIVRVVATMSQFDLLKFVISMGGCIGFYSFLNFIYEFIVTLTYGPYNIEKVMKKKRKLNSTTDSNRSRTLPRGHYRADVTTWRHNRKRLYRARSYRVLPLPRATLPRILF